MNHNASQPLRPGRVAVSPRARRLLGRLGLDARNVRGTSWGGRIVVADVEAAAAGVKGRPGGAAGGGLSVMRRAIAEKTALSFSTVPHFYLRVEADVTALLEAREGLAPAIERAAGVKPTVTDLLLLALARALVEFPFANSVWQANTLAQLPQYDLGLVVGLPDGLLIPVLRGVDRLGLVELAKARSEAVAAARAGQLAAEATRGGATSLTNLGKVRVDEFAPVIAPGQSSMLAAGRCALRPFVVDGKLAARQTLRLCLAADHRVMDGGPAAEFLGRITDLLEQPDLLLREPGETPHVVSYKAAPPTDHTQANP